MTIKNPPPNPLLLQSFANNPQQSRDIQELNQFLYLLWNSLGVGEDLIETSVNDLQELRHLSALSPLKAQVYELSAEVGSIRQEVHTNRNTFYDDGDIRNLIEETNSRVSQLQATLGRLVAMFNDLQQEVH